MSEPLTTHCPPERNLFAFLRVISFSFNFSGSLGLTDFLQLSIPLFRYAWSLTVISSEKVPFSIANPKDYIVLYFQKSHIPSIFAVTSFVEEIFSINSTSSIDLIWDWYNCICWLFRSKNCQKSNYFSPFF